MASAGASGPRARIRRLVEAVAAAHPPERALLNPEVRGIAALLARELGSTEEGIDRHLLTMVYIASTRGVALRRPVVAAGDGERTTGEYEYDTHGEALLQACTAFTDSPTRAHLDTARALLAQWMDESREDTRAFVRDSLLLTTLKGEAAPPLLRMQAERMLPARQGEGEEEEEGQEEQQEQQEQQQQGQEQQQRREEQTVDAVTACMRRAFWDTVRDRARQKEYPCLFDLAREMRGMLLQLLRPFSPVYASDVEARFDVDLLQQQQEAGLHDFPHTLRSMILYVTHTLGEVVAAADAEDMRAWRRSVEAELDAAATPDAYIEGKFIDWLARCFAVLERMAEQLHVVMQQQSGK